MPIKVTEPTCGLITEWEALDPVEVEQSVKRRHVHLRLPIDEGPASLRGKDFFLTVPTERARDLAHDLLAMADFIDEAEAPAQPSQRIERSDNGFAEKFLERELRGREVLLSTLTGRAEALGISKATLYRARRNLGAYTVKRNGATFWAMDS